MAAKNKTTKPTPFLLKVLDAVERRYNARQFTTPSWIASDVFPDDHPGWGRVCKCGPYGSTRGSGLVMMMGGYLGKLKHREPPLVCQWIRDGDTTHCLTEEGRKLLDENRHLLKDEPTKA